MAIFVSRKSRRQVQGIVMLNHLKRAWEAGHQRATMEEYGGPDVPTEAEYLATAVAALRSDLEAVNDPA